MYLTSTACKECGDDFAGNIHEGVDTCPSCVKKFKDKAKADHFAELDKLTLEERVRKLEEQMYEHGKIRHGYIPPPKF